MGHKLSSISGSVRSRELRAGLRPIPSPGPFRQETRRSLHHFYRFQADPPFMVLEVGRKFDRKSGKQKSIDPHLPESMFFFWGGGGRNWPLNNSAPAAFPCSRFWRLDPWNWCTPPPPQVTSLVCGLEWLFGFGLKPWFCRQQTCSWGLLRDHFRFGVDWP